MNWFIFCVATESQAKLNIFRKAAKKTSWNDFNWKLIPNTYVTQNFTMFKINSFPSQRNSINYHSSVIPQLCFPMSHSRISRLYLFQMKICITRNEFSIILPFIQILRLARESYQTSYDDEKLVALKATPFAWAQCNRWKSFWNCLINYQTVKL